MPEPMPRWFNPQRLINLLTQQRDQYEKLRLLSERQRVLITSDKPEQLLNILQERQQVVSTLAELNTQLAPFRQEWDGLFGQFPEDIQQQATGLLDEINSMLGAILNSDKQDSELLAARKESVGKAIAGIGSAGAAQRAYTRSAPTRPQTIASDLKS